MSFSFEQLNHPQPSLTHVACISARQVASAVVAATSSTVSTGSRPNRTSTAKPISSTRKQDQATHPAVVAATSSTVSTGSRPTRTSTAKPISSTHKQDQATHPAQPPPAKQCLLAFPGSLSFRLD